MNDNPFSTNIEEIEGEINSLIWTLYNTYDKARREEIEETINELKVQKDSLLNRRKKSNDLRKKYKYKPKENSKMNDNNNFSKILKQDDNQCIDDEWENR